MTPERRLAENLHRIIPSALAITQGVVTEVNDLTCTVEMGDALISGVRLRASLSERERQVVMVPKVGSAVTLGSLSGDLNDLVVIQVDEVERMIINGGHLGGLVNIEQLTDKINELVEAFNSHTHQLSPGAVTIGQLVNTAPVFVPAVSKKAIRLNSKDYEDKNVTH